MKKNILILCGLALSISFTSAQKVAPQNWFNLDLKKDKVPGVSSERAYTELLANKQSTTVVVAVIDGGTEVDHEDLKDVIWTNTNEIPGNNIDDDKNGYIDDIHGWNFIGGKTEDVNADNLELSRVYKQLSDKFEKGDAPKSGPEFEFYKKVKADYEGRLNNAKRMSAIYSAIDADMVNIAKQIGNENPTVDQLKKYTAKSETEKIALGLLTNAAKNKVSVADMRAQIKKGSEYFNTQLTVHLNTELNTRTIVGDHYEDLLEKYYGNNHYEGPSGDHGTHVAGIIAATRTNTIGIMGVSNNVKIMVVRVVPDGDERDKDIANAIRYAVDNGAKIINMSFGKSYSPYKTAVDDAVRYAVSKNVLLVHAAGNDNKNTDTTNNFPRDTYSNSTEIASSWLEIGASSWKKGKDIPAEFSNYGKQNVDVFAPGVDIYSTIPDSKYASFNGTSMAAPVTAGVAALVWSYYPTLTANQLKEIILQSSIKVKGKVYIPSDDKKKKKVAMTELCQTGGIVNAYEAVKLAEIVTKK
jgi:subtilisin family serine protease